MRFEYNDGGRADSGRKGLTGDCVCRAIAIASNKPYDSVYAILAAGNATQRKSNKRQTASHGISTNRKWFKDYMISMGFMWTPTMAIGQGCTIHLRESELPKGKLVVMLSKHCCAVIDGVINDIYDPQRDGSRCVYGYYKLILQINR